MKKTSLLLVLFLVFTNCGYQTNAQDAKPSSGKSIKIAILLDTSNSMDGLIDQAKSQLWSIVNELAKAKCDNLKPELKIALYEYGNDNLPASEGYIRMVTPLTNDLDQISADLFSLRTRGGQEFCGHVIQSALNELQWSNSNGDYQVVFIAGNEPFTQGSVDFRKSCTDARKKGVVVNTIFCGNFDEGVSTFWKDGALLTGGDYLSIEQNRRTVYIETPYDKDIVLLNDRLNSTYIYYGHSGKSKKELQSKQDANASTYGASNSVSRVISKSSYVYNNSSWDLVDASKDKKFDISQVESQQLPQEMQKMTNQERINYVNKMAQERESIAKQVIEINKKREQYLVQQKKNNSEEMLDNAILESVKKQATNKSFQF